MKFREIAGNAKRGKWKKGAPGGAPFGPPGSIVPWLITSSAAYNPCPVRGAILILGRISHFQRVNFERFPRSEIATGLSHRIWSFWNFHDFQRVNELPASQKLDSSGAE